ncbi:hypothetical protein NMYAN_140036 [Nitrosomonas nitrosa]|uniref:DUF86 domain-containing protein n=1 Tax=Nitrosomonas nitrosa TaxID=52442 RepID=A0A8H9D8S0_9PROT|nr:hypothetical protein NMYAN_140036 [Nitrosomonas nitrosa]
MSDASQREWCFYLDDMIDFAGKVLAYTDGLDQAGFVAGGLTYDATLRNLELIGEAATHIPDDIRAAHPEIPWRMIIATRNRVSFMVISVLMTTRSGASYRMMCPGYCRCSRR